MSLFKRKETANENPVLALSNAQAGLAVATELVEKLEDKLGALRVQAEPLSAEERKHLTQAECADPLPGLNMQVKRFAGEVAEARRQKEILVSRLEQQQDKLIESAIKRFDAAVKLKEDYLRDIEAHKERMAGLPKEIEAFEAKLVRAKEQVARYEAQVRAASEVVKDGERELRSQIEQVVLS